MSLARRIRPTWLLTLLLAAVVAAPARAESPSAPQAQVIGGAPAASGSFPFMAEVIDRIGPEAIGLCSGTVVSPHLVLTAGHCAVDHETGEIRKPSGFTVVTGNVNWTAAPRQVLGVSQVLVFPNYTISGPLANWGDAALLVLSSPTSAPAIALNASASASQIQPGAAAAIAGWGQTSYEQETLQTELEWAETVVQSSAYCQSHAPGFHSLGQLCTVDPPSFATGACHGDSGGPLLAIGSDLSSPVEIGVVSGGYGECSTSMPSVFTRSDLIASWVNANIGTFDPPPSPPQSSPPPPAPTATAPATTPVQPKLPALTHGKAAFYAKKALGESFLSRFRRGRGYAASCRAIEETKQRCGAHWSFGPNDYYGDVTVYYAFEAGQVVWGARFTIHWVNDYCRFYSGHPGRCRVHTTRL